MTLLGGGVFGNRDEWITAEIRRAFHRHSHHGIDVQILSSGRSKSAVTELVERINDAPPLAG